MELEELIENTLRRKHLEEMMNRPEKEHTPLEGMDNEQIKRFALFLFEENQKKSRLLDEMIARLDEIGKDLKEVKRENASLLKVLLEANSNAEKVVLEYKLRDKEYRKLEQIAKLYGMEDTYRWEKFTADEIYRRRNSKETTEIIDKIRTELYDLPANPDENRSELMSKGITI